MEIPDRIKNKFEKLEGKNIVVIRTGIGLGGSTFSDLGNIKILLDMGSKVTLVTGFISPEVQAQAQTLSNLEIRQVPELDRRFRFSDRTSHIETIKQAILDSTAGTDMVIFSQPFSGDAPLFSEALSSLELEVPIGMRSYDPIREKEAYAALSENSFGLPNTRIISNQMKSANPNLRAIVVPEYIDIRKPSPSEVIKLKNTLDIDEHDIVILQPTRTDQRKRTDRGLHLAVQLQEFLPDRKVHYIIAATSKRPEDQPVIAELNQFAGQNNFANLRLMDSVPPEQMAVYMSMATITTFMSQYEGWGRIPAESSLLEKMCVTSRYINTEGDKVFDKGYFGFRFITEEDPFAKGVSNATIGRVLQYIHNPESYRATIASNLLKAQQFTPDALRMKLANTLCKIFDDEK
jgi:hypothetical protein